MAHPQPRRYEPAGPVLRINFPMDKRSERRQEYRIRFRNEAMVRQAMLSLGSAADSGTRSSGPVSDGGERGKSGWLIPPENPLFDDSTEGRIKRHRQETLDILEGLRPPRRYFDWQGCDNEAYFNRQTIFELRVSRTDTARKGRLNHLNHPEGSPDFSWEHLHCLLVDQLSERNRAYFPAWRKEMVPMLLFVGPEDESGVQRVRQSFALHEHTVFEFRMLMMDVSVRGWRDVLWLSYPGEKLPLGFRSGEVIEMRWGERMI